MSFCRCVLTKFCSLLFVVGLYFCGRNFLQPCSYRQNLHKYSTWKILGYVLVCVFCHVVVSHVTINFLFVQLAVTLISFLYSCYFSSCSSSVSLSTSLMPSVAMATVSSITLLLTFEFLLKKVKHFYSK